ncbi:MAG: hypothetical protein EBR99_01885 [Actinobacteria bacterium]|nr:hypothetical protein [Actinomycetota bacterium]
MGRLSDLGAVEEEFAPKLKIGSGDELDSKATIPPEVRRVAAMAAEAILRRKPCANRVGAFGVGTAARRATAAKSPCS